MGDGVSYNKGDNTFSGPQATSNATDKGGFGGTGQTNLNEALKTINANSKGKFVVKGTDLSNAPVSGNIALT